MPTVLWAADVYALRPLHQPNAEPKMVHIRELVPYITRAAHEKEEQTDVDQEADAVLLVAGAGISYGLGPGDGECWDGHPQQKEGGAMDWARTYSGGETMWGTEGPRLLRTARHWGTFMHAGFPALHKLLEETKKADQREARLAEGARLASLSAGGGPALGSP